jgi:uncharacterized membrane protein HdeD (DUF308 family)
MTKYIISFVIGIFLLCSGRVINRMQVLYSQHNNYSLLFNGKNVVLQVRLLGLFLCVAILRQPIRNYTKRYVALYSLHYHIYYYVLIQ